MSTDIEVWEIDPQSQSGTKLEVAEQLDTEKILEAVLASNLCHADERWLRLSEDRSVLMPDA